MLPSNIDELAAIAIFRGDTWVFDPANADKASKRAMSIDPESDFIGRDKTLEKSGEIPLECQLNLSDKAIRIYRNPEQNKCIISKMMTPHDGTSMPLFARQVYNTIAFSILSNKTIFESFQYLYILYQMYEYHESTIPNVIKAFIAWLSWAINNEWAWLSDPLTAAICIGLDGDSDEEHIDCMRTIIDSIMRRDDDLTGNSLYNGFVDIYHDAMFTDLMRSEHLSQEEIQSLEATRVGIETDMNRFAVYESVF